MLNYYFFNLSFFVVLCKTLGSFKDCNRTGHLIAFDTCLNLIESFEFKFLLLFKRKLTTTCNARLDKEKVKSYYEFTDESLHYYIYSHI